MTAVMAGTAAAQECLGTAEALQLTPEQAADIGARGLTFGFLTNNQSDDFSRTLVSGAEAFAGELGVELGNQQRRFRRQHAAQPVRRAGAARR